MKLKSIGFENYKAFQKEQTLTIKPITILIGKNSSGKSSIAKLFTLLDNSLSGKIEEPLLLNNHNVSIGGEFRDLVYKRIPATPVNFVVTFDDGTVLKTSIVQNRDEYPLTVFEWEIISEGFSLGLRYQVSTSEYIETTTQVPYICDFRGFIPTNIIAPSKINILERINLDLSIDVDYIGPFRIVPDREFHLTGQIHYPRTGVKGENAYALLGVSKNLKTDLHTKVGDWFEQYFNGWRLEIDNTNRPFIELNLVRNDTDVNIVDVGQGMGQALPLIVRANIGRENSLIILEQPELHLHPAAHGDLAELFAKSAKEFNQNFIIETHSENIILRIRKLIIENDFNLTFDDVIIYFVDESGDSGQELMEITIDEEGVLSNWPEGVFNENLDEVLEMRKALTRKKTNQVDDH